jgi:hypothetical protein
VKISFLNLSYKTKTNEDPTLLQIFDIFPLKNPLNPSSLYVFEKQSIVPVYFKATPAAFLPLYIISLLLTVSKGKEIVSEVVTIN